MRHSTSSRTRRSTAGGSSLIWQRWRVPLLFCMDQHPCTFAELWSLLPGVTPGELSEALRDLQSSGMIVDGHVTPNGHAYALTDSGMMAMPILRRWRDRLAGDLWREATAEELAAIELLSASPKATDRSKLSNQVERAIRRMIATGALAPGQRVPSIRSMAASLAISSTIVERVYERLAREGTLVTKPRSGTFVAPDVTGSRQQ